MAFYHYYLLLSWIFVLPRTLQGQECSTAGLQPYRDCVLNNSPCPCGACDPDPTDGTPNLVTPQPESCDDVQRIFCGLVRCCSVCEAEALAWYQTCTVDPFSLQTLNYTCELKCDFQPYLDQCVPTTLPTFRPTRSPVILTESPSVAPVIPSSEPSIVTESPTVITASPTMSIRTNQTDGGTITPIPSNTSGVPTSSATHLCTGYLGSSTLAQSLGLIRFLF
jgi:hypothetical protein